MDCSIPHSTFQKCKDNDTDKNKDKNDEHRVVKVDCLISHQAFQKFKDNYKYKDKDKNKDIDDAHRVVKVDCLISHPASHVISCLSPYPFNDFMPASDLRMI